MFRKIFWINIGLFVIIVLLTYNLYRFWTKTIRDIKTPATHISLEESPKRVSAEELEAELVDFRPSSRMSYTPVAEKDLFRPEREEWQPPPPPEEDEPEIKPTPYPQFPGQKQPEVKDPTVHGIIIIGESKKIALMQGWSREEPQQRTRKIPIGNGQFREVPLPPVPGKVVMDKVKAYHIGDEISESRIVDILPETVVLERESGERYEIILREQIKLDKWKLGEHEMQAAGFQRPEGGEMPQPQVYPGDGEPYPIPPGAVPMYPPPPGYMPMYPAQIPPRTFAPPPGFLQTPPPSPQVGQVPPVGAQRSISSPQNLPTPPGFALGNRGPYAPPGQFFPGQPRR